jgi:hypothetical protein
MFPRSDIGNRLFAAVFSFAITGVMLATVIDYATPLSGVVA